MKEYTVKLAKTVYTKLLHLSDDEEDMEQIVYTAEKLFYDRINHEIKTLKFAIKNNLPLKLDYCIRSLDRYTAD
jgi:hypothetical protein